MILVAALVGPSTDDDHRRGRRVLLARGHPARPVAGAHRGRAALRRRRPADDHLAVVDHHPARAARRHAGGRRLRRASPPRAPCSRPPGSPFLGLGDPTTWSWGRILYEAQQAGAMSSAWWLTLFPSLAILLLVLSATLLSIAYNDARNPQTRAGAGAVGKAAAMTTAAFSPAPRRRRSSTAVQARLRAGAADADGLDALAHRRPRGRRLPHRLLPPPLRAPGRGVARRRRARRAAAPELEREHAAGQHAARRARVVRRVPRRRCRRSAALGRAVGAAAAGRARRGTITSSG